MLGNLARFFFLFTNQDEGGGGVTIFMLQKWVKSIVQHGVDPTNSIGCIISDFKGHVLGFAIVYTSNDVDKGVTLWGCLVKEL
jgi:hypothetical protein